jgi:hypothetical protein
MSTNEEINPNSEQAFCTLEEFLIADEWHPHRLEDKFIFRVGFSGKNGDFTCYAQVRIDLEQFLFYVMVPVKAPDEKRAAVAEFITRANYGLRIGNFEMDFTDGEIRYKSSLDFEEQELAPGWVKNAIYPAVNTCDRYLPGLMQMLYSDITPEQAIAEIEDD